MLWAELIRTEIVDFNDPTARHLRSLYERKDLNAEVWDGLLDADPPFFEEAEQMRLL